MTTHFGRRKRPDISKLSRRLPFGARFAWLLFLSLSLVACAVPQDIKERPSEEGDQDLEDTSYRPVLVNPQPAPNGAVSIPGACNSYTMRTLLAELPDLADPHYQDFEVRWFLDYQSNAFPVSIQKKPSDELSYVLNPYELFTSAGSTDEPGYRLHTLDVVVSSLGFEGDARLLPHYRKPIQGSITAQISWTFVLTGDYPSSPFGEEEESAQCP